MFVQLEQLNTVVDCITWRVMSMFLEWQIATAGSGVSAMLEVFEYLDCRIVADALVTCCINEVLKQSSILRGKEKKQHIRAPWGVMWSHTSHCKQVVILHSLQKWLSLSYKWSTLAFQSLSASEVCWRFLAAPKKLLENIRMRFTLGRG